MCVRIANRGIFCCTAAEAPRDVDGGPLQALLDELEFNVVVAALTHTDQLGSLLLDDQFKRATQARAPH
jgi:hypothetical protein